MKVKFTGAAVVMGVASSGKTSVGERLARCVDGSFIEGDNLHPEANVTKMSAGMPLIDEDRWPWLQRIGAELAGEGGRIASCSALKRSYREAIIQAAGRPVFFVYLDGNRDLLAQRIGNRKGHFMPASLLDSQLTTLEPPAPDELARRFDIANHQSHRRAGCSVASAAELIGVDQPPNRALAPRGSTVTVLRRVEADCVISIRRLLLCVSLGPRMGWRDGPPIAIQAAHKKPAISLRQRAFIWLREPDLN